jgi:hypothetical protein
MTTNITTTTLADDVPVDEALADEILADIAVEDNGQADITTAEMGPVASPAPPKPKPITWETERNAAAAALAQAGATPREVRVLASLGATAAAELKAQAAQGAGDIATADDRAAHAVLATHRAENPSSWSSGA